MKNEYVVDIRCNDQQSVYNIGIDNLEIYNDLLKTFGCVDDDTTLTRYKILHNILYYINHYVSEVTIGMFSFRVILLKYNERRKQYEPIESNVSKYYIYKNIDYVGIGKYSDYPPRSKDESYKLEDFSFNKLFK